MSSVAERFKQIRLALNMNQQAFSSQLNMSQAHISKIENGKDYPSDKFLKQICETFEINFDWLKFGNGDMWKEDNELNEALDDNAVLFADIKQLISNLDLNEKQDAFDILICLKSALKLKYKTPLYKSLSIKSMRDIFCSTFLYLIECYNNSTNLEVIKQSERKWRRICAEILENIEDETLLK